MHEASYRPLHGFINFRSLLFELCGFFFQVSINPDLGDAQETLEVAYKAKKLEAGFNARYFIDVLQVMDSDVVELGFINDSSPCLLKGSEDKGFLGLIMPMRL